MTDLISIIIPIYNTPSFFLKKCFLSIHNQSYSNYEVIIVDSSDSQETLDGIRDYASKDTRVKVIKSLKGVSHQRNVGLDNIKGNYVLFIDSDDYVSSDYISNLLGTVKSNNADVSFPQLVKDTYVGTKSVEKIKLRTEPLNQKITDNNFFVNTELNRLVNPVKLYSTHLIGNTRFRNDLSYGEDMIFNYELSKKGYNACFCSEAIYTFTAIKQVNSAMKRSYRQGLHIIREMYDIYMKKKDTSIENVRGILFQYDYVFTIFYYSVTKNNNFLWCFLYFKYRLFYLKRHHSFKELLYLLFPFSRKFIKHLLMRV